MLKAWLGIDPGKSGAACIIPSIGDPIFFDWPASDNEKEVVIFFSNCLKRYTIELACLEKVSSMPKQGVKSMFSFGQNYGMWKMLLSCHNIPYINPTPQKWQKEIGITKSVGPDPKSRSEKIAVQMFPNAPLHGIRGGFKDGRADALLMAKYAMDQSK